MKRKRIEAHQARKHAKDAPGFASAHTVLVSEHGDIRIDPAPGEKERMEKDGVVVYVVKEKNSPAGTEEIIPPDSE
jgi:hypothetical protein